jgi:hypothetical protein
MRLRAHKAGLGPVLRGDPRGEAGRLHGAAVFKVGLEVLSEGNGFTGGPAPTTAGVPEVPCSCGLLWSSGSELLSLERGLLAL